MQVVAAFIYFLTRCAVTSWFIHLRRLNLHPKIWEMKVTSFESLEVVSNHPFWLEALMDVVPSAKPSVTVLPECLCTLCSLP